MPIFLATLKHKLRRAAQPSLHLSLKITRDYSARAAVRVCDTASAETSRQPQTPHKSPSIRRGIRLTHMHVVIWSSSTRESWSREQIRGFILFGKDGSNPFGWEGDAGRVGSIYLFVVHLLHQEQIAISKSIPRLNLVKIRLRFSQEHINKTLLPPISNCYL
jgi:hypothetical protein